VSEQLVLWSECDELFSDAVESKQRYDSCGLRDTEGQNRDEHQIIAVIMRVWQRAKHLNSAIMGSLGADCTSQSESFALRSFHYERPIFPLLLKQLLQKQRYTTPGLRTVVISYALVGPLFVAICVASVEQSDRSIAFVNALPVSTWKAATARVLIGWMTLVIPLITTAVFCQIQVTLSDDMASRGIAQLAEWSGLSAHLAVTAMIAMAIVWCSNAYAWVLLATVNQKTELRAGLIGTTVMALLLLATVLTLKHGDLNTGGVQQLLTWILMALNGTLWISDTNAARPFESMSYVSPIVHVSLIGLLLTLSVRRYGQKPVFQLSQLGRAVEKSGTVAVRQYPPFASARSALLWMQYRQSIPIAMCGFQITLLLVCIQRNDFRAHFLEGFGPLFGCILALVIGTGTFANQLEPELHTFWRSRPISPGQWFRLKYLSSALVLVVCYDLPIFLLLVAVRRGMNISADVVFSMLLQLFVYSTAVLAARGFRHFAYSAILATAAVLVVIAPPEMIAGFPEALSFLDMWDQASYGNTGDSAWAYIANATLLLGSLIASSTLLAAWLIKRDISAPQ
jgi:hypothetical protein